MEIRKVGIVGTGVMGRGIARAAALAGFPVIIVKWTLGSFEETRAAFIRSVEQERDGKKLSAEEAVRVIHGVTWTLGLHPLADCDLVIESIAEDEDAKRECFAKLDAAIKAEAIFATNTSTLELGELAVRRPDRFIGLHFFNPVAHMRLVEVAVTDAVRPDALAAALAFVNALGKQAEVVPGTPGYRVNRLLMVQLLEALRMLAEKPDGDSVRGIDACILTGLNHPMGPFQLMDLIGLDVIYAMAGSLQEGLRRESFSPPHLLDLMVQAGWLGKKTGLGFYDYSDRKHPRPNPGLADLASRR